MDFEQLGGWGQPFQTEQQKLSEEKRQFDLLADIVPERLIARGAKPVNAELLAKVEALQQANGIDSGFCFLYLAQAIFGKQLDWIAQRIGSCVASGDMRTTAYRILAEVFLHNDPESIPGTTIDGPDNLAFFAPYNYRAGRSEAGINGNSDGSLCVPHIRGKMKLGHLPCDAPGLDAATDALPEPISESMYRRWGSSNSLVDQFSAVGRKFLLLESSPVKTVDDITAAIVDQKKPANICSSWGFSADYQHPTWKDESGQPVWIWKRSGSWAHNMSVIGQVVVGSKPFTIIENSWANYHKGRKWFAIPTLLFESWLKSAECQTVGELDLTDNGPAWPEAI